MANYSELNLSEEIQKAIDRMGFTEMTEIQEKAIQKGELPQLFGDLGAKLPGRAEDDRLHLVCLRVDLLDDRHAKCAGLFLTVCRRTSRW